MDTRHMLPALIAVTLLSLAPAAEVLALEAHPQQAAAPVAESSANPKNAIAPSVQQAQKAYDGGSYEEAFIIVEPLAKMDHPDAQYLLGQMYELGRGVKQDTDKAVALFTAAANQGYAAAQAKLGQIHMEGKKDYASAMSWFQKAADQGYALAYSAIGDLYAKGYGVEQDKAKAQEYYRKAAKAGDTSAAKHLDETK